VASCSSLEASLWKLAICLGLDLVCLGSECCAVLMSQSTGELSCVVSTC
jgi:hypothetical protein